jgi:hypothetical protein
MADDQVGRQVGRRLTRLVNGVGVPDGILKGSAEVVRRGACASAGLVMDLAHAVPATGGGFRNEVALPALRPDQVAGDVSELRRKALMDEQDSHRSAEAPPGPLGSSGTDPALLSSPQLNVREPLNLARQ